MARTSKRSSGSGGDEQEINDSGTTTIEKPAVAAAATKAPEISPEMRAKLAQIRSRVETSVGQVVLQMMQLPRYRHQTLSDLNHVVIEPLLRDRVAIAYATAEGEQPEGSSAPVGVAIWASVSEEVHEKIQEQIKAGTFPMRLAPDDWVSGERLWLLDIVSLNKNANSSVLLNFKKIAGEREVQLHPMVASTVDAELLKRLKKS